jgi:hypothetical protein
MYDNDTQSIKGQKSDPGYKMIKRELTRPSAEDLQGGKAREILSSIMGLDMDSEAAVDLRDFVHGSAPLPKDVRNKG